MQNRTSTLNARRSSARTRRFRSFVAAAGVSLLAATGLGAPGDLARRFPVNDDDPLSSLPKLEEANRNPLEFGYLIQDLIARGERAFQKKEWERASKYYEALARLVPDRAVSFRRLCAAHAELGRIDSAAANCGKALTLDGARVIDHFRFVNLTLRKQTLSPAHVTEMEASIAHVRSHIAAQPAKMPEAPKRVPPPSGVMDAASGNRPQHDARSRTSHETRMLDALERKDNKQHAQKSVSLPLEIEVLSCKLAVRLRDEGKISACLAAMQKLEVDKRLVLPFAWAQALVTKNEARAEELIHEAQALALPEPALKAMLDEQSRAFAAVGVLGFVERWALLGVLASALVAVGVVQLVRLLKRKKLAPANQQG